MFTKVFTKARRNYFAYERAKFLLNSDPRYQSSSPTESPAQDSKKHDFSSSLDILIQQSRAPFSHTVFILLSIISGSTIAYTISIVLIPQVVPAYFFLGTLIPYMWLKRRANTLAVQFLEDYPSVLLATSSSVRAGLTPADALERAVELLPDHSLCRIETKKLISDLNSSVPRHVALSRYGANIQLPELELFRSAFTMVLASGGKFAPTLKRLSEVATDASIMMSEAHVATASMRMTGNVLLVLIPVILGIFSMRDDNYWNLLLNHQVGHTAASIGIFIITIGNISLRAMSNFKA